MNNPKDLAQLSNPSPISMHLGTACLVCVRAPARRVMRGKNLELAVANDGIVKNRPDRRGGEVPTRPKE